MSLYIKLLAVVVVCSDGTSHARDTFELAKSILLEGAKHGTSSSVEKLLANITLDQAFDSCALSLTDFTHKCKHGMAVAGASQAGINLLKGRKLRAWSNTLPVRTMNMLCEDRACSAAIESAAATCGTGHKDSLMPASIQIQQLAKQCSSVQQRKANSERQQAKVDSVDEDEDAEASLPVLPPVVIIPALTATQLSATIKRESAVNSLCMLEGQDHLWPPDGKALAPGLLPCWMEEMSIKVDVEKSIARSEEVDVEPPGVHVHPDPRQKGHFGWEKLMSFLEEYGYRDGRSIFSAPYDWRHGPAHWRKHSWPILKRKVEGWVAQSGGKPAIFVADSMGGPYFTAFLLHAEGIDSEWKRRHVGGFVCASPVLAGVRAALGMVLWGTPYPVTGDPHADYPMALPGPAGPLKDLLRGFGSLAWIMPKMGLGETLVKLPRAWGGNLMAEHLPGIFRSQGSNGTAVLYELAQQYPTVEHPGVPVLCMLGQGLQTYGLFRYTEEPAVDPSDVAAKIPWAAKDDRMVKLTRAEQMVEAMVPGAAAALKQKGLSPERAQGKAADYLSGLIETAVTGKHSEGDLGPPPKGPPAGAEYGDERWLASVASLLKRRRPDYVELEDGDGLVLETSLARCDRWRGIPGLPDVDVYRNQYVKHSAEKGVANAMKYARDFVLNVSGVQAKVPKKQYTCERPSSSESSAQAIIAYEGREFQGSDEDFEDLWPRVQNASTWTRKICGPLSVAFRARWDSLGFWSRIIDIGSGPSSSNIVIGNMESSNSFIFAVQNGRAMSDFKAAVAKDAIPIGEEHDWLCTVAEDGHMKIYRDGKLLAEEPNGHAPHAFPRRHLYIGKSNWDENEMFTGMIRNLTIWSQIVDPMRRDDKNPGGADKPSIVSDVHTEEIGHDSVQGHHPDANQQLPLSIFLPVLSAGMCFGFSIFLLLLVVLCGRKKLRTLLPKRLARGSRILTSDAIEDMPFVDVGGLVSSTTEEY